MSTINKIFIDSSIIIEYFKGNKIDFLDELLASPLLELYISDIVCSEYLFHFLAKQAGKSPLSVKESKTISLTLNSDNRYLDFIKIFSISPLGNNYIDECIHLMAKHNLLPNDAMILTNCLRNHFDFIATYDKDLIHSATREGITSLSQLSDLKQI